MKQIIVLTAIIYCAIAVMPLNKKLLIYKNKIEEFQDESEAYEEFHFRLPRNTAPRVYKIEFDPDFEGESFTFKGNSTIIFEVLEPTLTVILHGSNRITIDKDLTELIDKNGVSIIPKKQKWNPLNEFYSIEFEEELEPENYTLKLKWNGIDSAEDWFTRRMGFFRGYDKLENDSLQ